MNEFDRFLKGKVGYRCKDIEDMQHVCRKLSDMGYTWLSGRSLLDFERLSRLYTPRKIFTIKTRETDNETPIGLCWSSDVDEILLYNVNGYEVNLI